MFSIANYCNNCFMKCPIFNYLVFEILNANLIAIINCGPLVVELVNEVEFLNDVF